MTTESKCAGCAAPKGGILGHHADCPFAAPSKRPCSACGHEFADHAQPATADDTSECFAPDCLCLHFATSPGEKLVPKPTRPETGTMQFGEDWPGVFIRGDNAMGYAMALSVALDSLPADHVGTRAGVQSMIDLLSGAIVRGGKTRAEVQYLKPFTECAK